MSLSLIKNIQFHSAYSTFRKFDNNKLGIYILSSFYIKMSAELSEPKANGPASDPDNQHKACNVPTNKTLAWRFGLELISVSVVLFLVLAPYLFRRQIKSLSKPQRRGFFCDDKNLKHPYLEETVRLEN